MNMVLAVAFGGATGAVGRYLLGAQMLRLMGPGFPWGTLAANIIGSFLMGVIVEASALKLNLSPELRAFLTVGVLGGFTTFSAFSLETSLMIERREMLMAALYAGTSVFACIAALFAGLLVVRGALA